ncbi:DUF2163 domain-containing protein [Gymnodinialimonas ceratoperidinii]|uniref:DUF2163 domain-containing protein n=1 Tax=Gymnodinialimonas ceratoperidinii TaxID=2856823 RepID=A0A8F6TW86_9RHOB|nr:DUF2163 domain-containing protein [Gymnodinialimonas ceratoperidinii]QXT38882.1 DUF2163 domain-containing protein [Gymnodinialimonas ceratoperidinii]
MSVQDLDLHLKTCATGVARCWRVTRGDGAQFGFTDHDCDLDFDGTTFRAGTGLSATALSQTTGLSVDNTEAVGALSAAAITEEDIFAGRFDGADVESWLVQWAAPVNRVLQFRGSIGEITRANGAFSAELRGLAELMNKPTGRVCQRSCEAVLGDASCGFDLTTPGYVTNAQVRTSDGRVFTFDGLAGFEPRWFERGTLRVMSGAGEGLAGVVKLDRLNDEGRDVELWDNLRADVVPGDTVRLTAGCDKRMETCRLKFLNLVNFRGFPDIPDGDWQVAHPSRLSARSGGSRR